MGFNYKSLSASSRICIVFAFAFINIFTYVLAASAGTPVFSNQTPIPDSVAPSSRPAITVDVKDDVYLKAGSSVMTVNGVRVSAMFTQTPLDPSQGRVSYYPSADLPYGVSTVTVSMSNANGTIGTTSWSYNVNNVPQITEFVPREGSYVWTRPFIIRAKVTSTNGIKSVTMTLDGKPLRTTYTNSEICYNPTLWDPPVPNGTHTVQVIAIDTKGVSSTATWSFIAEFYSDTSTNKQCTGCHTEYPSPNHPVTNCAGCHFTVPALKEISWPPWYGVHDSGYIIAWECQYCHAQRFTPSIPIHPADNTAYHNTTTAFDSCRNCHAESLINEHTACESCHSSTASPPVQNAVASQDKRCEACHNNANHDSLHETPGLLDSNCISCHVNNLSQEHLSNPKTQTKTLTCGTCHDVTETTNSAVYRAVYLSNIQCAACHSQAHNLNLVEKLNADIPVYEGFKWSQPQNTTIFRGEPWISEGFTFGDKIVFSNRRSDVNGDAVFNFYKDGLTSKGWILDQQTLETGSNYLTAIFSNGKHKTAIMFDNRENHSLSSPVTVGFRITIMYN